MFKWTALWISVGLLSCSATTFASTVHLEAAQFNQLPGWNSDQQRDSLIAFRNSCNIVLHKQKSSVGSRAIPLDQRQWQPICQAALNLKNVDNTTAHNFFQHWFRPMAVHRADHSNDGLFTGYYLPTIEARHHRGGRFTAPLYTRPDDLISVNLGNFNPLWVGKSLVGKVIGHELRPYDMPRAAINKGGLQGHAKVIAWVDPVDRFFIQVQGSGAVKYENGSTMLLGFDGKNGSDYKAIGRVLVDRGFFTMQTVSMQNIKSWMKQHPQKAEALMNEDESFVFFRQLDTKAPIGTQQTPLTAARSLAVDQRLIPLGVPVWLDTSVPNQNNPQQTTPWRHLLVTQDTGGAIRGPVRGDVYWGAGDQAEFIAGHMKSRGRYWLLVPKA